MSISDVCRDVRLFLNGLARELPDIFSAPRPYLRPSPPRGRPAASVTLRSKRPDAAARRQAKAVIVARVRHWSAALGLEYRRVFVKDQRTLWGSCSGRKNLNFNWRLAAAPAEALDYVVIHELCHLREMNHSKKFWALVAAACPDYKIRRRWLRDNSALVRNPEATAAGPAVPPGAGLDEI